MSDGTSIEWTDATWNPIRARDRETGKLGWFCTHASPGCANCYAEPINRRLGTGVDYKPGHLDRIEVFLDEAALLKPLSWRRPRMIFVGSMTDLFGDFVTDKMLDRVFAVMALCPQHVLQVLTKRQERMRAYLSRPATARRVWELACDMVVEHGFGVTLLAHPSHASLAPAGRHVHVGRWPLPNVWLGVSVEDQRRADERIPILLDTPAAVRWISAEPLLEPVEWKRWLPTARLARRPNGEEFLAPHFYMARCERCGWIGSSELCGTDSWGDDSDVYCASCKQSICGDEMAALDWVVAGGESGPGARPMHPDWARALRDQCAAAGVPFLFKQWGAWEPHPEGVAVEPFIDAGRARLMEETGSWLVRVGKKAAGRLLDGRTHDAFPEARR